jgi:plastocyanin
MNALDSRFIRTGDCFAHRFSTAGTFRYALSPLPSSLVAHSKEPPALTVTVSASSGTDQNSHYVTVSSSGGKLDASPAQIKVAANDLVVWSPNQSVTMGFRVRGRIGDDVVDSGSLYTESIFTHAFGLSGRYEWRDANGSPLTGSVVVAMPDKEFGQEAWLRLLEEGKLVHVRGDRAEPSEVEIVVGQTVVWAVEDAPGVTITDANLIQASERDSR